MRKIASPDVYDLLADYTRSLGKNRPEPQPSDWIQMKIESLKTFQDHLIVMEQECLEIAKVAERIAQDMENLWGFNVYYDESYDTYAIEKSKASAASLLKKAESLEARAIRLMRASDLEDSVLKGNFVSSLIWILKNLNASLKKF